MDLAGAAVVAPGAGAAAGKSAGAAVGALRDFGARGGADPGHFRSDERVLSAGCFRAVANMMHARKKLSGAEPLSRRPVPWSERGRTAPAKGTDVPTNLNLSRRIP
jgi:hypothetical protein